MFMTFGMPLCCPEFKFSYLVDFLYQEAKAQNRPIKSASRSRYLPTRYNPQVQLIHNQGYGDYLHFNERSAIDEPIWNSQRFDVRLLTRKIRRKQHLAAHAHIQTITHTMWMRTVSCVASVVLYQINDVSELYNTLMDTQEQVESKTYHLGTEGKSTPFASFTSDSAVQWQHSHTKSGEVCLEVKQRASIVMQACREYWTHWYYHHSQKQHWSKGCKFVQEKTKTSICMVDGSTR